MTSNGKYILMNDIDLSGVEWSAKTLNAGAEFNGNGYTISNLTINSTESNQGLFKSNNGTIKNLNITNATVSGKDNVGILVGGNGNTAVIENCFVSGIVTSTGINTGGLLGNNSGNVKNVKIVSVVNGGQFAGGLSGNNNGQIANADVEAEVSGTAQVGGVTGLTNAASKIEDVKVSGSVTATGQHSGGIVGQNQGAIKNAFTSVDVSGTSEVGGLVGWHRTSDLAIENSSATGNVTGTAGSIGGLVGNNVGILKNVSASGEVNGLRGTGGLIGNNSGKVYNAVASGAVNGTQDVGGLVGGASATSFAQNVTAKGNVVATATTSGGLMGYNAGTIINALACGNIDGTSSVGGLVGHNIGATSIIENASATGKVTATGNNSGGLVGNNAGTIGNSSASGDVVGNSSVGGFVGDNSSSASLIINSYSLGSVKATSDGSTGGGFVAINRGTIENSYSKGDVYSVGRAGGFASNNNHTILNCYSTGNVTGGKWYTGGFVGSNDTSEILSNCYSTGIVYKGTSGVSFNVFAGSGQPVENCYANSAQPAGVNINQAGVTAVPASWFEDGTNLMFLGNAYDYYYNPPELWGNGEAHPEEFTQFQVGANSGEKNQLEMNLQFRMYNFYGDVSSVESASDTLERVDAFKERLSEHRSMIGSVRNRLDSVLESQSIRLENLNSSHSTIVDTDFAAETAKLTRNQILQQATSSLLSQANFMPNIALQLLQ